MIDEKEVLAHLTGIRRDTLHLWIARGWITPERDDGEFRFREIDVARLRLIWEFRTDMDLGDDALDVILPLLDQVHGLRRQVHRMAAAVSQEPKEVRQRIGRTLSALLDRPA